MFAVPGRAYFVTSFKATSLHGRFCTEHVRQVLKRLVSSSEQDRQTAIRPCLKQAMLGESEIRLALFTGCLVELCQGEQEGQFAGTTCRGDPDLQTIAEIIVPISIRRRGIEKKLVLKSGNATSSNTPNYTLIAGIARARNWFDKLMSGQCQTLRTSCIASDASDIEKAAGKAGTGGPVKGGS